MFGLQDSAEVDILDRMTQWNHIVRNITLVGQLGLSLVMPLLLSIGACYYLISHYSLGIWIYIPGFVMGLGASFMTAYKVYLSVTSKEAPRRHRDIGFNKHL